MSDLSEPNSSVTSLPPKPKTRRPRYEWTQERVDILCALIASGFGIKEVCVTDNPFDLPGRNDRVYAEMARSATFSARIARAREAQQEHEVDYCVELARSARPENCQAVQLQIWAWQWRASKLIPRKYGEK